MCNRVVAQAQPLPVIGQRLLGFVLCCSFTMYSARLMFSGPGWELWQARAFLLLLGNHLSNGCFKWKAAFISNSNAQAKRAVKTPHFDILVSSLLQLSLLRAGSLHGKRVGPAPLLSGLLASSSQAWTRAWLEVKTALSSGSACSALTFFCVVTGDSFPRCSV